MSVLMSVFVIAALGYLVGAIKIKGVELGTAGVLLVALVFGHFGIEVDKLVRDIGLVCFVTSVGFIAGPKFFRNFKNNAMSYILMGLVIIISGAASCWAIVALSGIPTPLGVGLLTGALTSTPGLAAALEAAGGNELASIGYGIAYPFGVISVVLFVQLVPRFLKLDMIKAREEFDQIAASKASAGGAKSVKLDPIGIFPFSLAVAAGLLLAMVKIPLPGGASFSLGTSGGPLVAGLIIGHFGHAGKLSFEVNKKALETMRELGLMLFLIGAGTDAGAGFIKTLQEHGAVLFLYGAIMALVPMFVGFALARRAFKLSVLNSLGSITGGMTSTPALGTLIQVAGTDNVASAYAATYPIALVAVVLCSQFLTILA